MKNRLCTILILAAMGIFLSGELLPNPPQNAGKTDAGQPADQERDPEAWPREAKVGNTTFVVHQPQLDSWDGRKVEALAAIEVKIDGQEKVGYGAARISAVADVDKTTRMVEFVDLKILKTTFPSSPEKEPEYLKILQDSIVQKVRQISLDRFETAIAVMEAQQEFDVLPLKNDPPKIIHSKVPAILVFIDGTPAYRTIRSGLYARVVNTRPLILKDEKKFYLRLFDGWMESEAIAGPWKKCKKPPKELDVALKDAVASGQVDLMEGKADAESKNKSASLSDKPIPVIYIATAPTELIVTDGDPKFVPIPGTALEYAENTTGHIFKNTQENKLYILVSGRWFRSDSFEGQWEFVPGGKLPEGFAKIPDDSPKENVKASIPGTPQALEAVIAAHIPQTATVNRAETKLDPPQFDGEPQFKALGSTDLQYAANTATPIIRIDAKTFYAVENGIWFKSTSVSGPWEVADSVPGVIYTIPPSAPLHYVTYVRVYGSTPTTVDVGYTAGYYGTMVTHGSGYVVVYGTGYYYNPWVGSVWFGPPITYGCGTSIAYTPWGGWTFSFGFGWSWGYPMYPMGWGWGPYPWWGPVGWGYYYPYPYYRPVYGGAAWGPGGAAVWGPGGWAATSGNVYRRYGDTGAVTRTSRGFNAWTGNQWASQVGMSYNSRNGNIAAGQRGAVHNVYTGDYAYGGRGSVTSGSTGKTVTGGRLTVGNSNTGQSGSAGYIRGESGGIARVGDSIYAGRDGTVYRRGEGGWEQNSGSGWNSVNKPAPSSGGDRPALQDRQSQPRVSSGQIQSLNRQSEARSLGQTRTMSNRNFNRGGMGGARMPGGGGIRRR